jgi:predicted N-acetyltransferase YhbS
MTPTIRAAQAADAPELGRICYQAFKVIAEAHGFIPDFPSPEMAAGMIGWMIAHPSFFSAVAEIDGAVVGGNFLDMRNPVSGVGPITVDPAVQNGSVGRALMGAVIAESDRRGFASTRLVQAGYHCRSLALYLKLGFEAREHLVCLQGPAPMIHVPGAAVRTATAADAAACNALCFQVHGHARAGELADAIAAGRARVAERGGRLTGYATDIAFSAHAVGETNDDLKALIGAAAAIGGPGLLAPTSNGDLVRWCMGAGLVVTQTLTLMSRGLYQSPRGAWLPSIAY